MKELNYRHLHYFLAIVQAGGLTAAARQLGVAQSALSIQLKALESSLGCHLFSREHKRLTLTEEGRMAHAFAETIFRTGEELVTTLKRREERYAKVLWVGCVATLSRNFVIGFLRSAIAEGSIEVVIRSGGLSELLHALRDHQLDIVVSNQQVPGSASNGFRCRAVADQPVSLIGPKSFKRRRRPFRFPDDLRNVPIVLPTRESGIRSRFDALLARHGDFPLLIAAEADDMAMLRLLAREMNALSLLPPVVV
ncbi:MAG TPA: LysR family transcriptional regulator, partial [Kiritimatiellia bacterium]|nr:LysR family transcriptional regulator [Kiritimatiellia bacterium]